MPGVYEVKEYEGKLTLDGGMLKYIDPEAAIKRCLEIVEDPKDIVIDMIAIGGMGQGVIDGTHPPSEDIPDGFMEIVRVMEQYPDVQYRHLISPTVEMQKTDKMLHVDQTKVLKYALEGEKHAFDALQTSPGQNFAKLKQSLEKYPRVENSSVKPNFLNKANDILNLIKYVHNAFKNDEI